MVFSMHQGSNYKKCVHGTQGIKKFFKIIMKNKQLYFEYFIANYKLELLAQNQKSSAFQSR